MLWQQRWRKKNVKIDFHQTRKIFIKINKTTSQKNQNKEHSSKLVLPAVREDSRSTTNTSACWSSPYSSGKGTSPVHAGVVKTNKLLEHLTSKLCVNGTNYSAKSTLMLSGRPSSCRLSFSLFVIMFTVSSTFGLVLLLLFSCWSSVPVGTASCLSVLPLHVSASSDCLSFSSTGKSRSFRGM